MELLLSRCLWYPLQLRRIYRKTDEQSVTFCDQKEALTDSLETSEDKNCFRRTILDVYVVEEEDWGNIDYPVPNALVKVESLDKPIPIVRFGRTGFLGFCSFFGVVRDYNYKITVSKRGFKTYTETVYLEGYDLVKIFLERSDSALNEINGSQSTQQDNLQSNPSSTQQISPSSQQSANSALPRLLQRFSSYPNGVSSIQRSAKTMGLQ